MDGWSIACWNRPDRQISEMVYLLRHDAVRACRRCWELNKRCLSELEDRKPAAVRIVGRTDDG